MPTVTATKTDNLFEHLYSYFPYTNANSNRKSTCSVHSKWMQKVRRLAQHKGILQSINGFLADSNGEFKSLTMG